MNISLTISSFFSLRFSPAAPPSPPLAPGGANLNLTNLSALTPVHHTAEAGALDALKSLLEAAAKRPW